MLPINVYIPLVGIFNASHYTIDDPPIMVESYCIKRTRFLKAVPD